jgi:hypothetical protein
LKNKLLKIARFLYYVSVDSQKYKRIIENFNLITHLSPTLVKSSYGRSPLQLHHKFGNKSTGCIPIMCQIWWTYQIPYEFEAKDDIQQMVIANESLDFICK